MGGGGGVSEQEVFKISSKSLRNSLQQGPYEIRSYNIYGSQFPLAQIYKIKSSLSILL